MCRGAPCFDGGVENLPVRLTEQSALYHAIQLLHKTTGVAHSLYEYAIHNRTASHHRQPTMVGMEGRVDLTEESSDLLIPVQVKPGRLSSRNAGRVEGLGSTS